MADVERDTQKLQVIHGTVERDLIVGNRYPLLGTITEVYLDPDQQACVMINGNITARIFSNNKERDLEFLRERAFETAIFMCRVVTKEPTVLVECESIIFGEQAAYHA